MIEKERRSQAVRVKEFTVLARKCMTQGEYQQRSRGSDIPTIINIKCIAQNATQIKEGRKCAEREKRRR